MVFKKRADWPEDIRMWLYKHPAQADNRNGNEIFITSNTRQYDKLYCRNNGVWAPSEDDFKIENLPPFWELQDARFKLILLPW